MEVEVEGRSTLSPSLSLALSPQALFPLDWEEQSPRLVGGEGEEMRRGAVRPPGRANMTQSRRRNQVSPASGIFPP